MNSPLAALPSVDRLLQSPAALELIQSYGRSAVTSSLRDSVSAQRARWLDAQSENDTEISAVSVDDMTSQLINDAARSLVQRFAPSLTPVINLTGIVIHTNLGRAPYPREAIDAMALIAAGNSNLEYDLQTGQRGQRDSHVVRWLCELTGAQDALVVNNNAAAVMLCLNTLALNRKVLVSRGELIEIGGSFRMPEIMRQSGTRLKEVGTTNRTHLADYEAAITRKTAAIMKVHTSNYEVVGFTKGVEPRALAALANAHDLPFIDDLGSGNLIDLKQLGLPEERTVRDALEEGAALVTFSGDKLLGGPQCGIVAGRSDLIARLKKNPMKRALRLDKVTLCALESVLRMYASPERLVERLPVLNMLTRSLDDIKQGADQVAQVLAEALGQHFTVTVEACASQIGSGSLPTRTLDSWAAVCRPNDASVSDQRARGGRVNALAQRLRHLAVPVIGRMSDGALWLDCRTLLDATALVQQLRTLADTTMDSA